MRVAGNTCHWAPTRCTRRSARRAPRSCAPSTRLHSIVAAAALAALLAGTAGCSHAPAAPTTLVFTGLGGEPDSLNPLLSGSADLRNLSRLYLSFLVDSDARGTLVPDAARAVPTQRNGGISADGRTITYHLRAGMRWQDGTPLTARDVAFTYRAVMNAANDVPTRVGYAEVDGIRTPDPLTIAIHLRRPFAPIVVYFCGPEGYGLLPAHLLARYADLNRVAYNERPVGSGPYRVVAWRHGDSIAFAANRAYWRGAPRIARMIYRVLPDPNARLAQLETGEVGAYFDVDPQLLPQVRAIRGVHVSLTPVNDLHVLDFNVADPIVGDLRIRRAIARAIDRKKLILAATHGAGLVVDGDQPLDSWAYLAERAAEPYDPRGARALLRAAGWNDGPGGTRVKNGHPLALTLVISPQAVNGSQLVATMLQAYLRDVGIAVAIKAYAPGMVWAPKAANGILATGRFQLAYDGWWLLGPDPDDSWQFACDQIPPAGFNHYFWCDRAADAAIRAALRTYDRAARRRDYERVQAALRSQLPELTLWQVRMPDAYRGGLHGLAPSRFGSTFWNAWTWRLE